MEIELKMSIDPADVALLPRHPLVAAHAVAPPRRQRLLTTYFDTDDFQFREHRAVVRARRAGGRWIQTLKAGDDAGGVIRERDEWETPISGPHPDLPRLRECPDLDDAWRDRLADLTLQDRLRPIFVTQFHRTTWGLRFDDGTEAELALDIGAVESEGRQSPISEIELELKSGSPQRLFEFALELEETIGLSVSAISKSARGFALLDPAAAAIVKALPIDLTDDTTVAQGMRAVIANCLAQIQGNEAGVIETEEVESVHQMRVGIRRLRSALRLFDRVLPCPPALIAEIKWFADSLGAARDWEVLATTTLSAVEGAPDLQRLTDAVLSVAKARRKASAADIRSRRYTRLLLSLGQWMQEGADDAQLSTEARSELSAPLAEFAGTMRKRMHRRLLKRITGLEPANAESRHALRKYARRVRYASEFFRSFQRAGDLRQYVKSLTRLQDELGRRNDAAVAGRLLGELDTHDQKVRDSAQFASGFLACNAGVRIEKLKAKLKKIEQAGPPHAR